MPADEGVAFLLFAMDKEEEAMLFQRWLVSAQFEMSFDEFKEKLKPKIVDDRKTLQDVENIMKSWEAKNGII